MTETRILVFVVGALAPSPAPTYTFYTAKNLRASGILSASALKKSTPSPRFPDRAQRPPERPSTCGQ